MQRGSLAPMPPRNRHPHVDRHLMTFIARTRNATVRAAGDGITRRSTRDESIPTTSHAATAGDEDQSHGQANPTLHFSLIPSQEVACCYRCVSLRLANHPYARVWQRHGSMMRLSTRAVRFRDVHPDRTRNPAELERTDVAVPAPTAQEA